MPRVSLIVPSFNAAQTLPATLQSLTHQSFQNFELIVVDDGSKDDTARIAQDFPDTRLRLVRQENRGLSGARNAGIAVARGEFLGFCDADDLWHPTKLATHVTHLDANPSVGVSYSGSALIDARGEQIGIEQRPRRHNVTAAHIFKRNPVGNGSSPVIRRAALESIRYRPSPDIARDFWFDETFRQSEDIECWMRLALTTDWAFEGVAGALTLYRISGTGLSASIARQSAAWSRMVTKLTPIAPDFFARYAPQARAYQHRYLARRAVSSGEALTARAQLRQAFAASWRPLWEEPVKTLSTCGAVAMLAGLGPRRLAKMSARMGRNLQLGQAQ